MGGESGNLEYEYSIRDHLGNTRLTFADKNGNNVVDITNNPVTNEILQENHYTPFGLELQYAWMNDAALDTCYRYPFLKIGKSKAISFIDRQKQR